MKRTSTIISIVLFSIIIFVLGFQNRSVGQPQTYYQVYLDDLVLGTISSKVKLEEYIDKEGAAIKNNFGVDKVYAPSGLEVRKITTFNSKLNSVLEVYNKLNELKPFTISGYQFTIKKENNDEIIYVTDKDIFKESLEKAISTFVGKDYYELYLTEQQVKIETTGTYIDNVYIDEDITIRETKISVNEKIFTDVDTLSKYLLFGTLEESKTYTVKLGDTIDKVALANKINIEEFLIANSEFTSSSNLLFPGQVVSIGVVDPRVSVVVETTKVDDRASKFTIETKQDVNMVIGEERVVQKGENGLDRITTKTKTVNGNIVYARNEGIGTVLKPMVPQVVMVGTKQGSPIGGAYWTWPTQPGWMITSDYNWRYNPFNGSREFHRALDIAGPGYGSKIYASNNGVVTTAGWHYSYGNYIIINHNNGYYTLYAHMSALNVKKGSVVSRGHVIGYMGMTGSATGPHLHYELWVGEPFNGGYQTNPWMGLR